MSTTTPTRAGPTTTSSAAESTPADPTSLDPTLRQLWRAARAPVAVAALVLLAALALAAVSGGRPTGYLDPRAADRAGSRAVAEVLRDQGVEVDLVRTTAALRATVTPQDAVLVALPDLLVDSQVRAVRATGAALVVAGSGEPGRWAEAVRLEGPASPGVRAPGCALPAARRAGDALAGRLAYRVGTPVAGAAGPVEQCYPRGGHPSLVRAGSAATPVTLLGNPDLLTNAHLADDGNAALALGLLGERARLVWYLPTPGDVPASAQRSFYALVPDGVWWALVQVGVAVLVVALWRARRLGPVVPEPLPVVVRAAETVEGRGRLYRRSGARDKAAAALREAALTRLRRALGLPRRADPRAVVDAVAARTGRPPAQVAGLLYGAAPADDAALVRLADDVDALVAAALAERPDQRRVRP